MGQLVRFRAMGWAAAGLFALVAGGCAADESMSEGTVSETVMAETSPSDSPREVSQSEPAPEPQPEPVPPKRTSSVPPPPPSAAVQLTASQAPAEKSAEEPPVNSKVFPYRLQRSISPRNGKGEKEMTFPLNLYDEDANARADVSAACEKARKENKRVLVIFGENYCGFCAWLHDTLVEDPRLKGMLDSDYVTVFADLGKPPWGKNLDLALEFGLDLNRVGAPAMSVLEAATQRTIQSLPSKDVLAKPMTMARVFDAEQILRYLTACRVPQTSVQDIMNKAQREAAADKKNVMFCFVSSSNERSTKFRRLMSSVEIAPLLERDLVVKHIDVDRVGGAGQQLALYAGPEATASDGNVNVPWWIVVEPGGKMVVDSNHKGKNLGLPSTDDEIAAMIAKVAKSCPSLDSGDRLLLKEKLEEARKE